MQDGSLFEVLRKKYNLSYHIEFCSMAMKDVGLRGKRVLEVGGSLPRELVLDGLEAGSWTAIQELTYFEEIGGRSQHGDACQVLKMGEVTPDTAFEPYTVLLGGIEDLPEALFGQFDVVFSIAAFEHILRMGCALEKMAAALAPGGRVYSIFAPIWSAHDGHHLPKVVDQKGRVFDFANSPIPPWGHLLMRPAELYSFLINHTDPIAAQEMVYYVYHSPHINRLFVEDYLQFLSKSSLHGDVSLMDGKEPDPDIQEKLQTLYPGRQYFYNCGFKMLLRHRNER